MCLLTAGCANYMTNRDSVTLGVGNAMLANVGIHTIDPFPPNAQNTDIDADGRTVARAQRIYARGAAAAPPPPSNDTNGVATNGVATTAN